MNNTAAKLKYDDIVKSIENEIAELYRNYQVTITWFKKEARIAEVASASLPASAVHDSQKRANLPSSSSNLMNIGYNNIQQNGLTPRDDIEMLNAGERQQQQSNNEFNLLNMDGDNNTDSESKLHINNKNKNRSNNFVENKNTDKDLIYHNQNSPSGNLNAGSQIDLNTLLNKSNIASSAAQQQSNQSATLTKSNLNSTQKIPEVSSANQLKSNSTLEYPSFTKNSAAVSSKQQVIDSNTKILNNSSANNSNLINTNETEIPLPSIAPSNTNKIVSNSTYFIGIKSKPSNEIIIFNIVQNTLKTLRIDESCFQVSEQQNQSFTRPALFPYENSKYVNIGSNSALITGGNSQKNPSDTCFKVTIVAASDENSSAAEKVQISKWPSMQTKRERHNILYIPDSNQVIVCSGFYVKSCESLEIPVNVHNSSGNSSSSDRFRWRSLPELAEPRGNATMFYVNSRFVYILGGFKVNDSTGEYLNSLEYLDIQQHKKHSSSSAATSRWNFVNIESLSQNPLRISAMGCLSLGVDRILLVGGYDGSSYLKDGYEVQFEDGVVKGFVHKESLLPRGSIFFSNPMFMKINNNISFNFELQGKGIVYDSSRGRLEFSFWQPLAASNAPSN